MAGTVYVTCSDILGSCESELGKVAGGVTQLKGQIFYACKQGYLNKFKGR